MKKGQGGAWDIRVVVALGTALLVAGLGAFLWLEPTRVSEVAVEHGPMEWLQAAFLLAGLVVTVGRALRRLARGRAAVPELLLGILLAVGLAVELSLHSWAGFRIRHGRFALRRSAGPVLPWFVLSVSLIGGLAAMHHLGRHSRTLLQVVRGLPRSQWGQLMIAGVGAYAASQLGERPLARLTPRQSYFLEEAIELFGTFYLFLAAWWQSVAHGEPPHDCRR
jgi:hypothetical protein